MIRQCLKTKSDVNWSVPKRALLSWCLALIAALFFAAGPAAAQDNMATVARDTGKITVSVPEKTVLTYSAAQLAATGERRRAGCKPGGMRGRVECDVTKPLSESDSGGTTPELQAGAILKIPLTPRLEGSGGEFSLSLSVGEPYLIVSGVNREVETNLRREAARVVSSLRRWRHTLSRSQVGTLRRDRSFATAIARPFEGLSLFTPPDLKARWAWGPTGEIVSTEEARVVRIYFAMADFPNEPIEDLVLGRPFRVVVVFDRDPERANEPVTLTNLRSGATVRAIARQTHDARTFHTQPLHFEDEVKP